MLNHWALHLYNPFEHTFGGRIASWSWFMDHARGALSSCSLHCFELRGCLILMLITLLSSTYSVSMVGHRASGAWKRATWSFHLPTWWGGVFFSRFVTTQWHTWLRICCGYLTWLFRCGDWVSVWWFYSHLVCRAFCFCSHIDLGSKGKMSTPSHFQLEQACKDSF